MADNKNMELNDEMLANAAGGDGNSEQKKFFVGDRVTWLANYGWAYGTIVEIDDAGFCHKVLVDQGLPNAGKIVNKHARNLFPIDM